ncbi:MAG: hypothetical protein OHK0029_42120 [Armatimonadaceae bacterium]
MKICCFVCLLLLSVTLCNRGLAQSPAKPNLTAVDLKPYTYHFVIKDGKLNGDGAEFLKREIADNQYILLGEYHNSHRISRLTEALIPILHDNGFRFLGLEIGPVSGQILDELAEDEAKFPDNLRRFNSRYYVSTPRRDFTPIPFFSNVEDAEFLREAAKHDWKWMGLDQEFSYGYAVLLDRMFENLSRDDKATLANAHEKAIKEVEEAYRISASGGKRHYLILNESEDYQKFVRAATVRSTANKEIADALQKTTEIYSYNANRRYFQANSTRIDYIKRNLQEGFARFGFDLKKDRMLLKMGGVHTAKGFSDLSLFDVGNTLHELARFHGNRSLHINFLSRFYMDNGKERDPLDNKDSFGYRQRVFLQMAKKDQWTIIDLRPLRSDVFYAQKYDLDPAIMSNFRLHDIVIIPETEIETTENFDRRDETAIKK